MDATTASCVLLLAVSTIAAGIWATIIAKSQGRILGIQFLLIVNFIIIQPLSGLVHLTGISSGLRGYYDLFNQPIGQTVLATAVAMIGLLAICLGCKPQATRPLPELADHYTIRFTRDEFTRTAIAVAIIAPTALFALSKINAFAATAGRARIISVDGGAARFSFMSDWSVWAVSLAALLVLSTFRGKRPWSVLLVLIASVVSIAAALSWSGGRSVVLLMLFPLTYLIWPLLRELKLPALLAGGTALVVFVLALSANRLEGTSMRYTLSLWNWIDWEWGRFSMSGMAAKHVEQQGYLYGETLIRGVSAPFASLLGFFGIPVDIAGLKTSMAFTSRIIRGNFDSNFMVPGLAAELFANFGLVGVSLGLYLVGRCARAVDNALYRVKSPVTRLLLAFIGSLIVFRVILADSAAPFYFLLFSAMPLVILQIFNLKSGTEYRSLMKRPGARGVLSLR